MALFYLVPCMVEFGIKNVIGMGNKSYTRSYVSINYPLNSKIFELFE